MNATLSPFAEHLAEASLPLFFSLLPRRAWPAREATDAIGVSRTAERDPWVGRQGRLQDAGPGMPSRGARQAAGRCAFILTVGTGLGGLDPGRL